MQQPTAAPGSLLFLAKAPADMLNWNMLSHDTSWHLASCGILWHLVHKQLMEWGCFEQCFKAFVVLMDMLNEVSDHLVGNREMLSAAFLGPILGVSRKNVLKQRPIGRHFFLLYRRRMFKTYQHRIKTLVRIIWVS